MCGIFCEIWTGGYNKQFISQDEQLQHCLNCRGPDSCRSVKYSAETKTTTIDIYFYGTVLWMQGDVMTAQPLENDPGILLYNGDIFDATWDRDMSDTAQIMNKLSETNLLTERVNHIIQVINQLKGPYSLIYLDKVTRKLFFTRDRIGRNSLLFYKNEESMIVSSVLGRKYKGCIEIPASGIHVLNLENMCVENYGWQSLERVNSRCVASWYMQLQEMQTRPDDEYRSDDVADLLPTDEDEKQIMFIETVARSIKCRHQVMAALIENEEILKIVDKLILFLKKSVKIRLETQPNKCQSCMESGELCKGHSTIGVLFSGGLDCTILALLADEFVPKSQPIDLLNVAFRKNGCDTYEVPDRLTGKKALGELKRIRPLRQWRFFEINVPQEELERQQQYFIADLVYPRQTILDESLGSALWFAARGTDGSSTSPCRVLLLGSGADELFGGYMRHRTALRRQSWPGLNRELLLDWQRIAYRNLARDNRVICHHGRQPRMPYLDEDFTTFVLGLKPWQRCLPIVACEPGLGDKLYLRLIAFKLGLVEVSRLPKRALQFGSRIANKKENGADISLRFLNS